MSEHSHYRALCIGALPEFMDLMSAFCAATNQVPVAWRTMRTHDELRLLKASRDRNAKARSIAMAIRNRQSMQRAA